MQWQLASVTVLLASAAPAAEVRLLSEFRRVGAEGDIVAADKAGRPREIISPALVRNGYTSFHVVAAGPPGAAYMLYIAENPDGVVRASMYRVVPSGSNAPPDKLDPVKGLNIPGIFPPSGIAVYWLDLWTPANAPVRRVRVEAQLNVANDWVITPMEVRIQPATVPLTGPAPTPPRLDLPAPGASSGDAAFRALRQYLCGGGSGGSPARTPAASIREFLLRNARQDAMLAAQARRTVLEPAILKQLGVADQRVWCAAALAPPPPADPETFLRLRDLLLRESR